MTPRKPADNRFAKVLIHAPAGAGKTTFLGSAQEDPRTFPMAFLNFEGGEQSLSGLDIDVFDIRDSKDYEDAFKIISDPKSGYRSTGVDSVTETQVSWLLEILSKDKISRADPDQLAQRDWGIILVRMRRVIRQYVKMLPMHVFMTALSKDVVVARVGTVKMPSVQGQFAHELPGIMDVVGYLAIEDVLGDDGKPTGEIERLLLLHSYPKFSVKVRSPWGMTVPSEIVDPTVGKLLDALEL